MIEKYYAIRIGDPRRHRPYLLWSGEGMPLLFLTRKSAETECRKSFKEGDCAKVVPVSVSFAPLR